MKHKKSIGCCLAIILCIVGFVVIVYQIAKFHSTMDYYFDELGNDYAWDLDDNCIVKITSRSPDAYGIECLIPGKVENCSYDDNYIIVYQKYDKLYSNLELPLDNDTTVSEHYRDSIKAGIERLRKMKECYWIIYKKKDIIAGPFNKHDFDIKCKKEGIDLEFSLW